MALYLGNLELAVGGGATGTGLPVNSYAPFYAIATDNPTGYNSSTGLYEHPNGDVWLKTGKTITATSDYPDAAINQVTATGFDYSNTSYSISLVTGLEYDQSADEIVVGTEASVKRTSTSFVDTGFSFSTSSQTGNRRVYVAWDGTSYYVMPVINGPTVYKYDSTGTYTGTSFSLSAQFGTSIGFGLSWYGSTLYVGRTYRSNFYRYSSSGSYLGSYSYPASTSPFFQDAGDAPISVSSNFSIGAANGNKTINVWNNSLSTQYAQISTSTDTPYNTSIYGVTSNNRALDSANSTRIWMAGSNSRVYEYEATGGQELIGDLTARTDPDSGQPLFIKIK